jgi:hypothetical protein
MKQLRCYSGCNYEFSNDLPRTLAVPARFYGHQPAVSDQSFGCSDRAFLVSEGIGTIDANIARTDCWFGPSLKKIEQSLCRIFARLFDQLRFRSTSIQPIKQVRHHFRP